MQFIDALLACPDIHLAAQGAEWPTFRQLCLDKKPSSNAIPDAWLAAATLYLGEQLVSFDRDFRKLLPRGQFLLLEPA